MRHIKLSSSGFTLIELLFIVAIIGVILSLTINSYQQRTNNLKVEKTALQMQAILQAGVTYFNDNGCWPSQPTDNTCPKNAPDFNDYLPVGNNINPWGNPYIYHVDPTQADNFLIYSGTTTRTEFANRIASLLPNAAIDAQNNQQCLMQTKFQAAGNILITTVGQSNYGPDGTPTAFTLTCPNGWSPNFVAVPSIIHPSAFPPSFCFPFSYGAHAISVLNTVNNACSPIGQQAGQTVFRCSFLSQFKANDHSTYSFPKCTNWTQIGGGNSSYTIIGYCSNSIATVAKASF